MSTAKDLTRVAGLLSGSVAYQAGLPFPTSLSMLIEELVNLCETSSNELSVLKYRVDNIIIGDFKTAVEFVKQVQDKDNKYSDSRKISALNKANELFMKTYYRLENDIELMEYAALSATYMGIIHCILDEKTLALKWLKAAASKFIEYRRKLKEPLTGVGKFLTKNKYGKVVGKVMPFTIFSPYAAAPWIGLIATEYFQKGSKEYRDAMKAYENAKSEAGDCEADRVGFMGL